MTKLKLLIVFGILALGLILRLHNYSIYPQRGASSDEYTYSFLGVSLLTKHVPISWSAFQAYENRRDLTIDNLYFPIVWPYFDHPPLSGLLVGSWAILWGQDTFEEIKLETIRLVPIFLSMVTAVLIFLLGNKLYGYQTGVWALLIYSTTAIFVVNGRVVFAENLLTPIFLLAVYFFQLWKEKMKILNTIFLGVLAGLSFWTKELGVVVFLTVLYYFFEQRLKLKFIAAFVAVTFFFILGYVAYGAYYDFDLFWKIISAQTDRQIGPQTLHLLLSTPIIVNKVYMDGWYFFGLFSFLFALFDYKKYRFLIVPALTYFLLMIFSLSREGEMGWYMIPIFPFISLFSANLLAENLGKKSWFIFVLLLFVGLYEVKFLYEGNFGLTPIQFRLILGVVFLPLILAFLFKKDELFKKLSIFWFYLLILGNIILTYNYVHPA